MREVMRSVTRPASRDAVVIDALTKELEEEIGKRAVFDRAVPVPDSGMVTLVWRVSE
jgi:hypothetical protein